MAVFDYKNHYEMKKKRLEVLKRHGWKCDVCGGKAVEVHHADESDDNHDLNNLIPICRECHYDIHRIHVDKPIWNTHHIEYCMMKKGLDIKDLAEMTGLNYNSVRVILTKGSTKNSTMKKIAEALDTPIEDFILYGDIRERSGEHLKIIDELMEEIISEKISTEHNNHPNYKYLHRLFRYWITKDIREHFGLSSWMELPDFKLNEAIDFLNGMKERYLQDKENAS